MAQDKTAKIFVMTHKKFDVPEDDIYIPVQVGHALHEDLGYACDDTGDNISAKNMYYSELTGLYWAAKNVHDADIMGLCHYRRFFLNEKRQLLGQQEYEKILTAYDVILPQAVVYKETYYEVYEQAHHIQDLCKSGEVIRQLYPQDYPVFEEVIRGHKVYCGNLFVTRADLFKEYTNWLFSIFDRVEQEINVESYDAYHKRVFGFLAEQLLYVWVKSRGLTVFEAPVGLTQEKAETIELKERLREKVAGADLQSIQEALALFRQEMKNRPDLILQGSDLSGELADMFRIIYICEGELKQQEAMKARLPQLLPAELLQSCPCMLHISTNLDILLQHYRLTALLAAHIASGTASEEEISYMRDARPSRLMLQTIINVNPVLKPQAQRLFALIEAE